MRGIRAALRGILLSSTLLVVITAAAVAVAAHEILQMPWGPAWVLGGALAPTDATAVAAMARLLPHRAVTVLRAESLKRRLATEVAVHEALVALPAAAGLLGTEPEIARRVHAELEEHLTVLASSDPDTRDGSATRRDQQHTALRLALITTKRAAVVQLRDERRIDDSVLRQVQAHLDIEEIRLTRSTDAFMD